MWISAKTFVDLSVRKSKAEGAAEALERQLIALHTTMDWMRVRLNQVEQERADLIERYLGVKISVPVIEPAPEPVNSADIFNQMPSFDDVGDEEAAKMGLDWNSLGELINVRN